jgi:hypothetical protein
VTLFSEQVHKTVNFKIATQIWVGAWSECHGGAISNTKKFVYSVDASSRKSTAMPGNARSV